MRKWSASILSLFFASIAFAQSEDSITITTYYPSPYGMYNELNTFSNTNLAISGGNVGIGTSNPLAKLDVKNGKIHGELDCRVVTSSDSIGIPGGSGDRSWSVGASCNNSTEFMVSGGAACARSLLVGSRPNGNGWLGTCYANLNIGDPSNGAVFTDAVCCKK